MRHIGTLAAIVAVSVIASASCGGPFAGAPGPGPTPVPAPPPEPPEPALVRSGAVFAYAVGGEVLDAIRGPGVVEHGMDVDGVTVRLRTPPGWEASYAGAVWMQSFEDTRARFVVHLAEDHERVFREDWRGKDAADPAVIASEVLALDSDRRPFLYTYRRTDDGRHGIVYALLAEPGRPDSGIIVHGVWPAEYDRRFRPVVVASANGVSLSRP